MGLGLVAIAVGVLQGMYEVIPPQLGWSIIGTTSIGAIVLVILGIRKKGQITTKDIARSKKAEAQEIHSKMITLETGLWVARDKVTKDEDALENAEVKQVLADINDEINSLATLVKDNNLEVLLGALLSLYSKHLEFDASAYDDSSMDIFPNAHARIRWYINHKIKN